jgi:N-acetylneuraminic acid mutarotase
MNFKKSLTPAKIVLCGAFVLVGLLSLSSIRQGQEPWTEKTPMPTARLSMGTAVVDGKIYAIGGGRTETSKLSVVEVYDPVTDSWDITKTPMPTARGAFGCTVVDGKIYAIGGGLFGPSPLSIVEVYDPVTDSWNDTTIAPMPTARSNVAACTVNGKIYVIGGTTQNSTILAGISTVEEYDPVTNSWTKKSNKPTPAWGLRACVLEGKIYVTGGNIKYPNITAVMEVYDPIKDEWETTKAPILIPKYSHSICVCNENIYSFGGWNNCSTGPFYKKIEVYNSITDKWIQTTDIPLPLGGLSAVTVGDKIYIMGGTSTLHPFTSVKNVYEYNPDHDLLSLIEKIEIDKSYAKPGTDNVCIKTKISDPSGITIMAHIDAHDQTPVDSMQLFDDGNHDDGNASDSLYANVWPVSLVEEQHYYVDLQVTRVDTDTVIHHISNMATFTTIGPVTVENYTFTGYDTIPNPGDKLKLKITLRNNGSADTATKVTARLISLDSLVTIITSSPSFGNIVAGQNAISSYKYTLTIDEEWPGNTSISILVEISGEDYPYWKDTLYIPVLPVNIKEIREPITRIYPNPTNDLLNIEISNSGKQGLEIEIRDITGKVIYQKKYNNANARFTEQFDLSGFTKGIYLIKVRQADRVYVGKIIVR